MPKRNQMTIVFILLLIPEYLHADPDPRVIIYEGKFIVQYDRYDVLLPSPAEQLVP